MKKMMIAAVVMVAVAGAARAEGQALKTLAAEAGGEACSYIEEPGTAVAADKGGFFQRWGGNGGGDGFFKPWNKSAGSAGVGDTQVYRNAEGCEATVEARRNGSLIYVREAEGGQAYLWLAKDLGSGEITSFCSPAAVGGNASSITLSCGEHANGGYYTRGSAVLGFDGGLTSVMVRGDVKKALGWKTDTSISCSGLRPMRTDAARSSSKTFMGVEECSVLDGVYPDGMTGEEAQAILGACFGGISARYGVPISFSVSGSEMGILVGRAEDGLAAGNAVAASALKRELEARAWTLFDFRVSMAVAK